MSLSAKNNSSASASRTARSRHLREMILFAMLGTILFCSKIVMEALPNIHLLGILTVTYTVVFRTKALIPLYVYVFVNGVYAGFNVWWVPYLYIWTLLWGATMLIPRRLPRAVLCVVYPLLCGLHGLLFGILYAPAQALMFGLNFQETMAWIAAGFPFDVIHGVGNLVGGLLVLPLSAVLKKVSAKIYQP